jgi:hypothetical protein
MSRNVPKIETGGFPIYGQQNIRKVNAMRRAFSLPDADSAPLPNKGDVLFTTAEEQNDEPSSCYNCIFYNYGLDCSLIGKRIKIKKFIYGEPDKAIEYWPCCGMNYHGDPNKGDPVYRGTADPDYMGLIWINAPKVGQEYGGANCGGVNGGDDCDHYMTEGNEEKWESRSGRCRVLRTPVAAGDDCAHWDDDDKLDWKQAQKIIEEQNGAS